MVTNTITKLVEAVACLTATSDPKSMRTRHLVKYKIASSPVNSSNTIQSYSSGDRIRKRAKYLRERNLHFPVPFEAVCDVCRGQSS